MRWWGRGESLSLTRQGGGKINTKKNVPLVSFISLLGCYADLKNNVQVTTLIGKGYYHLEWIKRGKFIYIIFLFIKSCINGTFQFMIINHSSSKYLTFVWYIFSLQNSFMSILSLPNAHQSCGRYENHPNNKYRNETYSGKMACPRSHN